MSHPSTRFLLRALLWTTATVAVGVFPLRAWAGAAGLQALFLAGGVALGGALAGRLPRLWLLRPERPEGPVLAAMAGIGARLLLTAAVALVVLKTKPVPPFPFAVALVATYLVLLGLEVREAVREVNAAGSEGVAAR